MGIRAKYLLRSIFHDVPTVATGSFWEEVAVPGDSLSVVIMDKLPTSHRPIH